MGLICVDPGYDTGMSLLGINGQRTMPVLIRHDTINYQKSGSGAKDFFLRVQNYYESAFGMYGMESVDIVLEKFTKRPGVVDPELTAMKVMGVLDCWWAMHGNRMKSKFHERIPVQGKMMVTNQVLLRTGVWLPGHANRHINDATRHGISWLVDQAHHGTCVAAFPKED
jgi:hypothetical protein